MVHVWLFVKDFFCFMCAHTTQVLCVCLSQHHESVELATAETNRTGLRASLLWLDVSLRCSLETHQKKEWRKENKRPPPPPFFDSCHSVCLRAVPCRFFCIFLSVGLHCICVSSFPLAFFYCLLLPTLLPSTVASPYLFLLSLSLSTAVWNCWHRRMANDPLWSSRQFWDFSVSWGSLRQLFFNKRLYISKATAAWVHFGCIDCGKTELMWILLLLFYVLNLLSLKTL